MDVTFDLAKDALNINKHGISLQRAEGFDAETAQFEIDDSQGYGEVRWNALGWLDALLYCPTFTEEGEGIRAISLRKATRHEQKTMLKDISQDSMPDADKPGVDQGEDGAGEALP